MTEIKYGLTESGFAHIPSMSLLIGEDVKAGAMGEFGKMGKEN